MNESMNGPTKRVEVSGLRRWFRGRSLLAGALMLFVGLSTSADSSLKPFEIPSLSSWTNSLGMVFVVGVKPGVKISCWETRVSDFKHFAKATYKTLKNPEFPQTEDHPMVAVSWHEAKAFCLWLTERERRWGHITSTSEYRLPTDREWTLFLGRFSEPEALPRALDENLDGAFLWGGEWPAPYGVGNLGPDMAVDTFEFTAPVGSFPANALGLYDVTGNVWEWCEDWYDDNKVYRVLRGGSWRVETFRNNLATERHAHLPKTTVSCYGFRCVLVDVAITNP